VGRVFPRHGHRGRPLNSAVRTLLGPNDRIRWFMQPAPWRGLKVMTAAGSVFAALVLLGFVVPPSARIVVIVPAAIAWAIAGAGMIGHFRWSWKRGREGKVGFNDE